MDAYIIFNRKCIRENKSTQGFKKETYKEKDFCSKILHSTYI